MDTEKKESAEDLRRTFESLDSDGELALYYLAWPTADQIRKAEWHYSKVYNKALIDGVATSSEMMDILTKRGLYGPEYEKKLQDLQVEITLKIASAQMEEDLVQKQRLAEEAQELREELFRWNQRLTGPLSNTCEQMADNSKTEYLTSVLVQHEDGTPVWDSYEEFVSEKNHMLALRSRYEVTLLLQGLEPDFVEKTPENMILAELARERAQEQAKEPAQLEASPEDEPSEEPPKKKRRGRARKDTEGAQVAK